MVNFFADLEVLLPEEGASELLLQPLKVATAARRRRDETNFFMRLV
jgi:hypothetical protein